MLNHSDIMSTVDMIDHQHLDIRTITMGISLLDCADPNAERCAQKIYDKIYKMQKDMGVKNMKELNVPEEFCDTIAENVSKDKKWAIVPNPPDFDYLRVVLHQIWNA